ncbi:hypothetical protein A8144_13800 [Mycobacterium leprae 3125609]|nr:hypothetical protein A8144_13800 [Mycobacterium leprae 3125609]OAX70125.1 hypothetical protein A3216_13880 [Mycobacterium leprae 7935681]
MRADFIFGGHSNPTVRIYDDKTNWLVRHPPLHRLTLSTHDMARESSRCRTWPVPVARTTALCQDNAVLGAPFQVSNSLPGK